MKNWIAGIFALLAAGSVQADVVAPDMLIRNTAQDVIGIVKQDKDLQAGDQKKVLALVNEKILPYFDFTRMTQLAAGRYWRQASPEQKKELEKEFRTMLVRTYTKAFTQYQNQTIDVKPLKYSPADTEVTVKTQILKPGSQPTNVDYEMKKYDSGWKVFDVVIEGVSMVTSYRGSFASQIEQSGIDSLIKSLADMNAKAANTMKADAK
jgi:phospholipid transport system substrate-binding protein